VIFAVKPTVVGHRGFGAGKPDGYRENTIESFLRAVDAGLSWVELDVQRSSDGELVIRHDPVTPAGHFIVTRSVAELSAEGILTFDEVLAALPPTVSVNVDVKTIVEDATDPERRRTRVLVAEALGRYRETRRFFVSSFDASVPVYLRDHKALIGDVALGLISWAGFPAHHAVPAAANLGLDAVCLHTGTLHLQRDQLRPMDLTIERCIEMAHRAGLEVLAWSPTPAEAVRLAKAGVDALCVNDIPGVQAALASTAYAA
jgi:glycerophosphoryl diester phosphodiesterase